MKLEAIERSATGRPKCDWRRAQLGDLCKTTSGGTPSRKRAEFFSGSIPWLKSGELTDGPVSEIEEFITDDAIASSSARVFPPATLLIALYGATVGKLGIQSIAAATNQAVCAIFPTPDLDTKFLFWYLRHRRSDLIAQAVGGAQPNISQGILRTLDVPVPLLDEQRRIVAEIEKQFSRLDEAVANLKRVKTHLKRYKAAVLADAVEGELARGRQSWARSELGAVALSVRNGVSEKPDTQSGTRILRISAVRPLQLDEQDVRFLRGSIETYAGFRLVAGDVLFTRYNGSVALVGACAVVPPLSQPTVYPDKLIRVRVPPEVLSPAFLAISASTGEGRAFIESRTRTTAGQAGISGADIKKLPIRFPSVAEQQRIVAEVDRRLSIVREVEAEVDDNLKRAQALRQAVLARAFSAG